MQRFHDQDLGVVTTLLCDGDGTLFPSEEPAFDASVTVTNRCLDVLGIPERFSADHLRRTTTGKNFRTTLTDIARTHGVLVDRPAFTADLERWVAEENRAVIDHLAQVLQPDPEVGRVLRSVAGRTRLALVTSSALRRADACLRSTGLADLFPVENRFSAQDSLVPPTSKPDPAVYAYAGRMLDVTEGSALAIEDAVPGAQSAVAAGFPTLGFLGYVPVDERAERAAQLRSAGVFGVVDSWREVEQLLVSTHAEAVQSA
jgi:HAD superfamily hydrolase (TIGR01509 family)